MLVNLVKMGYTSDGTLWRKTVEFPHKGKRRNTKTTVILFRDSSGKLVKAEYPARGIQEVMTWNSHAIKLK